MQYCMLSLSRLPACWHQPHTLPSIPGFEPPSTFTVPCLQAPGVLNTLAPTDAGATTGQASVPGNTQADQSQGASGSADSGSPGNSAGEVPGDSGSP